MQYDVIIIGAGVAGLQTAVSLDALGVKPLVLEKQTQAGGNVRGWHMLFPTFTPSQDVLKALTDEVEKRGIEIRYETLVAALSGDGVELASGEKLSSRAVVVATGFDIFDARIKEEYGYGIYKNVFTSADIEEMFNRGEVATATSEAPKSIAILHCVGSRDEKVCQRHCSRVCCVVGVKQAIELKKMFPEANIYNFYMDIRMFGAGYEELYREAQISHNINFVRGRISEASQTIDGKVQIKAEDTLMGKPLKMSVDMLVLLVGMKAPDQNARFASSNGVSLRSSGFLEPVDPFTGNVSSGAANVFFAGAVTAPKNIGESINEGAMAAVKVYQYLTK